MRVEVGSWLPRPLLQADLDRDTARLPLTEKVSFPPQTLIFNLAL